MVVQYSEVTKRKDGAPWLIMFLRMHLHLYIQSNIQFEGNLKKNPVSAVCLSAYLVVDVTCLPQFHIEFG